MPKLQIASRIAIFHTIFIVCLSFFILFILLAVFVFIRLNIPEVIGYLTGRAEKKFVQQQRSEKGRINDGNQ